MADPRQAEPACNLLVEVVGHLVNVRFVNGAEVIFSINLTAEQSTNAGEMFRHAGALASLAGANGADA